MTAEGSPPLLSSPPPGNGRHPSHRLDLSRSESTWSLAALFLGLFWAIGNINYARPQASVFLLFIAGLAAGALLLSGRRIADWAVLGWAAAIGIIDRFAQVAFNGSDVIGVTVEAIHVVTIGGNPYAHTYHQTRPQGSPFPYLPGEIAWYGLLQRLTGHVVGVDKWAGIGIVLLLAGLAFAAGPGPAALATVLYATFQPAILRSLDGSNDTSLGFLILLAVVLLAAHGRFRLPVLFYLSAAFFGWALLFKAFAWLIYPFVVNHLRHSGHAWQRYATVGLGMTILVCLPFAATAPTGFVRNVVAGLSFHRRPFGLDIWAALGHRSVERIGIQMAPVLVVVAVLLLAAIFLRFPAISLGTALLQGCGVVLVALLFARYATSSYYTFVCAILAAALPLSIGGRARFPRSPYGSAATSRSRYRSTADEP
jgi:hypothetical protein